MARCVVGWCPIEEAACRPPGRRGSMSGWSRHAARGRGGDRAPRHSPWLLQDRSTNINILWNNYSIVYFIILLVKKFSRTWKCLKLFLNLNITHIEAVLDSVHLSVLGDSADVVVDDRLGVLQLALQPLAHKLVGCLPLVALNNTFIIIFIKLLF